MASCNVPVPGRVKRLASELHPRLTAFDRIRDRHTLVVKRLETTDVTAVESEVRRVFRDASIPPFEARVAGVDYFERPVRGPGPVVYLAVESPGLERLHRRLVDAFGAVDDLEGDAYVPHVTLARGGDVADAERLAEIDVDPVAWTVSEVRLWSSRYRETVTRIPLG